MTLVFMLLCLVAVWADLQDRLSDQDLRGVGLRLDVLPRISSCFSGPPRASLHGR